MATPAHEFQHLTVAERIQLVEDIWDSIADTHEVMDLTDIQKAELDRRLAIHREQPEAGIAWASLRAEMLESP